MADVIAATKFEKGDVTQESCSVANSTDGPSKSLVSSIRRIEEEERKKFKRGMELEWVQLCPYCDQWVGRLVEHVKSAHSEHNFRMIKTPCPYEKCGKTVVDIKNHIRLVHDKVRNFVCELCSAGFTSSYHLLKHTESVHTNLRVECNQCGKQFKSTTIDNHVKRVHQGIRPSYPCSVDDCQKIFGSKEDMKRHVLAVHMKFKVACPECGKKVRMEFLSGHIKKAHHDLHNIKCEECGKGFQNKKLLSAHIRARHIGYFFYCKAEKRGKECGKILVSEKSLLKHVAARHVTPAEQCAECGEAVLPCYRAHHARYEHSRAPLFRCPVRGCRVTRSDCSALRDHVSTMHVFAQLHWCGDCQQFNIDPKVLYRFHYTHFQYECI